MRLPKRLQAALSLALLAGSLTACQTPVPTQQPPASSPALTVPAEWLAPASYGISQATSQQGEDPLNLTEAQRQAFQRISSEAQSSDRSSQIQKLLLAPTIDPTALKAELVQTPAEIDQAVSIQLRLRNLLTADQRQRLIQSLRQAPETGTSTPDSEMQTMQQQLNLTAEQRQAMTAMNTAMRQHDEANRSRLTQSQIALVESGNGDSYRQALTEVNRTMPVDAMVAFFTSLSQAQRQKLFSSSSGGSGSGG